MVSILSPRQYGKKKKGRRKKKLKIINKKKPSTKKKQKQNTETYRNCSVTEGNILSGRKLIAFDDKSL